jgi:ABC-type nitrate/sulfonate/bicarbonate transport system substrate-binding protein
MDPQQQSSPVRRTRRRRTAGVALVAVTALALAACGSSSSSATKPAGGGPSSSAPSTTAAAATSLDPQPLATKTSIAFGYSAPLEVFATPQIAVQNGEFTKENLDVDFKAVPAASWPQLLGQGQVKFMIAGFSGALLNAIHSGVDIEIIGLPFKLADNDPSGLYIQKKFLNADGSLKKPLPKDFSLSLGDQGLGAVSIVWTQEYMKKNGLSVLDTRNVNLSQPDIALALQRGSVDAGFANNPYAGTLVSDSDLQKVANAGAATVIATTKTYADQHPDVVRAVLRALARTNKTELAPGYRDNTKIMGQLSSWLKVPDATIKSAPAPLFSSTMAISTLQPIVQETQQTWLEAGGLLTYKDPISFESMSNPGILASAVPQ